MRVHITKDTDGDTQLWPQYAVEPTEDQRLAPILPMKVVCRYGPAAIHGEPVAFCTLFGDAMTIADMYNQAVARAYTQSIP